MAVTIGNDSVFAARCIQEGKLVAIPTETVYGLGADAFNPIAVAKIFETKKRPSFDPLIVHIADITTLASLYAAPISEKVFLLAERFWPGPLTIVYKKKDTVPDIVTSGLSSVAVRMPLHPLAREVILLSGTAIAAPSANLFGQLSPTKAQHVAKQLHTIDYILDGGNTHFGIESTVVSIHDELVTLLRPGAISLEELKTVVPEIVAINKVRSKQLESPGFMESHYSPCKPLYILEKNTTTLPAKAGLLLVSDKDSSRYKATEIAFLSKNCDLLEVAAKLFASLHAMEENNAVDCIYIEPVEEKGIGVAIMDRLRKAAYQYTIKKNA